MRSNGVRAAVLAIVLVSAFSSAFAGSQGTAFTYQGRLDSSGAPAGGIYDFRFKLFDAAAAGNQVGSTVNVADLNVVDGLFTASLDFGAGAFNGSERWLEIEVSPNDGNFTKLTPRQQVTATPYALFSLAPWATQGTAVYYNTGAVGIGTSSPGAGLHITTSAGSLSLNATDNLFVNSAADFVGVNRSSRVSSAEYFGVYAPEGSGNYGGMYIKTDADGQPFYGYTDGSQSCWTYFDGSSSDWFVHNGGDRLVVRSNGRVGIGTSAPDTLLTVNGTGHFDGLGVGIAAPEATGHFYNGSGTALKVEGFGGGNGSEFYGGQGPALYARSHSKGVSGKVEPGWDGYAIYGEANDSNEGGAGVYGFSYKGKGVYGYDYAGSGGGVGVYGRSDSSNGYGVYCYGDFGANGSKSFVIDHPLDPANKILKHYCPEGPEPLLVYSGNVVLDASGAATVQLPAYFEAINKDLRYQLTCIGGFAQVYVAQEVANNEFKIAGGKPGLKVSWQVSGVRNDAYMQAHGAPTEIEKTGDRKGLYIAPELYGNAQGPSYYGLTQKAQAPAQGNE